MTTITATPDSASASVRLEISTSSPVQKVLRNDVNGVAEVRTLQGQLPTPLTDTEYRRNLVTNPSFGLDTAGWSINPGTGGAATLSRQTLGGYAGSEYLRASWTAGATAGNARISTTLPVAGKANDQYLLKMHFREPSRQCIVSLDIEFLSASDVVLSTYSSGYYSGYEGWAYLTLSNAQSSVDFAKVRIVASFDSPMSTLWPKTGNVFDIDAVLFEKTDAENNPYFDGSIYYGMGTVPGTLTWTGTPHASQSIIKNTGTLILVDYEAAAGTNTYSVIEETDTGAAATTELVLDQPWLLVPILPNYSGKVRTVTNYGSARLAQSTVHSVIGRADPLVALGVLGDRTGSLEIFCESIAQARKLETVFNRGEIVLLKQNVEGLDMYLTATSTTVSPYAVEGETQTRYALSVQYVEMKRPIGDLAGALGWDFNALANSYASFNEVALKFATFNDLTIQKEK